ncbi:MAG: UpxY family transcription antiterminator [Prevotella sp.]|nr:UpxY family transcription antiterminator [Prevotella sp.]
MITLSDVTLQRGNDNPPNIGFVPDVIPKAIGSNTGVSVRYEYSPNKHWFVLRISYGRVNKAKDLLDTRKIEYYLPLHYALRIIRNKKKRVIEPLIPNILFVYTEENTLKQIMSTKEFIGLLSYYYNHFERDEFGKNPPLIVDYKKMEQFISLTTIMNEHIKIVDNKACNFKSGDFVRVTDGMFKGIEGRVARVSGQQRVIVELKGLCLVATAYIPTSFIERL